MDHGPEPVDDAGSSVKNLNLKKFKKNSKNPTTVCFPVMGSSGGVELNKTETKR